MTEGDLLRNVRFVKLTSVGDLLYAEAIQKALRQCGIGAVIINDEKYQARTDPDRAEACPPPEGFRLEVPDPVLEKARAVLAELRKADDAG